MTLTPDEAAFWESLRTSALWSPDAWLQSADGLKRAADELASKFQLEMQSLLLGGQQPRSSLGPPYMLLAGHAVEALCKGHYAATHRGSDVSWTTLHVGPDLLDKAGQTTISEDEAWMVEKLEAFVRWAGTYPAPLRADALVHPLNPVLAPFSYSTGDVMVIDALFERLSVSLHERIERGNAGATAPTETGRNDSGVNTPETKDK